MRYLRTTTTRQRTAVRTTALIEATGRRTAHVGTSYVNLPRTSAERQLLRLLETDGKFELTFV